jgi:hypothetical protein
MRGREVSSVLLAMALASGCCAAVRVSATDSREVCLLRTEPAPGLPRLYRRANAQTLNLGPAPLLCDVPKEARKIADRCEEVDDLLALLGTGQVCSPTGVEQQPVCPGYSADRIRIEAPAISAPLCAAGCENRQLAVHEASGTVTRVLFYDDPACHSAAAPGCPGTERRCYYRVLALTSELR